MITAKQMKSLPKGEFSNSQLATVFKTHGKKNREVTLPVDKHGLKALKQCDSIVKCQNDTLER
jgi:hypothetical protein